MGATLFTWAALLVMLGVELLVARLSGGIAVPLLGVAMAVVVAMTFMRLPSTPRLAAIFAMAGVFWVGILLGLGSLDRATRHDVDVPLRTEP